MVEEDRIRMECTQCGFKCVPQWFNDEAHCLKCDAILRTRAGCQEKLQGARLEVKFGGMEGRITSMVERKGSGLIDSPFVTRHRGLSQNSESPSSYCLSSPDGEHHYRFGKCHYCQKAEQIIEHKPPGSVAYPGGVRECLRGGKCMFKFAKCTKCGKSELDWGSTICPIASPMPSRSGRKSSAGTTPIVSPSGIKISRGGYAFPEPAGSGLSPMISPSGKGPMDLDETNLEGSQPTSPQSIRRRSNARSDPTGIRNERIRMDCPECGFTCVPQWMNDEASCLKCHTVLMVQSTCHDTKFETRIVEPTVPASSISMNGSGLPSPRTSQQSGSPIIAMDSVGETLGGACKQSPDGKHHWKFGKCNYCQINQGEFMRAAGLIPTPSGVAGCAQGGKCMFKFARCQKCGQSELL
eukprot:gnl/MRDRNA2_/MRDRNA2_27173_c0_seq1.p1 gnl/MRDRNA2_/MRDRNA2_27173_c0~~gnl/MRDRNA2_/MRDRNA2_27173_c0_seq1.p1  ORF type:complete len:410 (-),score=52.87 gnl/MRDRNA2_/MRDRNA2_27173_c0_seq1:95-1324(-)